MVSRSGVATKLSGGSYNDAWRVVAGGVATTLLYGSINVQADPWGAAAPVGERQKWRNVRFAAGHVRVLSYEAGLP